jgi:hypothetical protein
VPSRSRLRLALCSSLVCHHVSRSREVSLTAPLAYKAYFFAMAKVDNPFGMSNVLSTAGLVAIIINSLIVVRYGRRRVLLMTGLIGCGFIQLIVALVYQQQPGKASTGKVIVGLSCIYMMLYNGMIVSAFPTSKL